MNILLLIDNLGSGGAQRQIVTLGILLNNFQQNVTILTYSEGGFFKQDVQNNGINHYYCKASNLFSRILKVRKFIRHGKYDVVISFMDVPNFLNNFAAIGGKSWKVITSERSSNISTFESMKGKIFSIFQRFSDFIVCNSYNAKQICMKYMNQYTNKLRVIYNPVILPLITSEYRPKQNNKINIIIAASYQYLKNPLGLINAVSLMSEDEKAKIEINWYGRADVAKGNTQAYDESKTLIKQHRLEDVIHLNEPTMDIANVMKSADVIALFSKLEGLPNAICEGMMIGKPIIMTKVSDYNNLVDESNGFLCDWDNPESIKNALVKAANLSVEQIELMGAMSREKAKILFSTELIINQWIDLTGK